MKISPLTYSPVRNYSSINGKEQKTNQNLMNQSGQQVSPSFKSLKAGLCSLLGTGLGAGLGMLLGVGLLATFYLGGIGSIAGGIFGQKGEPQSDEYGCPFNDELTGFDYIG